MNINELTDLTSTKSARDTSTNITTRRQLVYGMTITATDRPTKIALQNAKDGESNFLEIKKLVKSIDKNLSNVNIENISDTHTAKVIAKLCKLINTGQVILTVNGKK